MQLHLTDNKFNTNPHWSERVKSIFACPPKEVVELFDQNGYDLTKLEQLYAVANGAVTTRHRNSSHITLRQDWFTADDTEYGPHINHAYMSALVKDTQVRKRACMNTLQIQFLV